MDVIRGCVHWLLDSALGYMQLLQNREVGWLTVVRRTGEFRREQQPILKKLKLLFLFNPLTQWIDRTHLFRLWTHEKNFYAGKAIQETWDTRYVPPMAILTFDSEKEEVTPHSHKQISGFIDFYDINMNDFSPREVDRYSTFQNFFVRRHAPGARPLYASNDPTSAVIVADSRVVVYNTVEKSQKLWIKGDQFTIGNLVRDEGLAKPWHNGAVACFRLSPQDYHRYHSPVAGKVKWFKHIPGDYFQVDPVALHSSVNILTENARCAVCIESEEFGKVLFVAIGAADVGTVQFGDKTMTKGQYIEKGEELGLFKFGGSTITVVFEKDRIQFDWDLENWSREEIMVDVEVGMSMGSATVPGSKKQAPSQSHKIIS